MSAWTYRYTDGKAAYEIVPPRLRIPWWKGPSADSEEKHEPVSDIDTAVVDSLKALDLERPIREADIPAPPLRANKRHFALQQKALLFDHLVGAREHDRRNVETECLCGLEVNYRL